MGATTLQAQAMAGDSLARHRRRSSWLLLSPAVILLALWAFVPLVMTLLYSFQRYNLLYPERRGFIGVRNYSLLLSDPAFWTAIINTVMLVLSVLVITIVAGILISLLLNQNFPGRAVARLMAIAPFFVLPPVAALIWKNLLFNPISGLIGWLFTRVGLHPVAWFTTSPMLALVIIVAWEWTPFATLILLTALQSLDTDQLEAARMDGAGPVNRVIYIVLPHLARPIAITIMMESIFLLSIFAEILTTTAGGPGEATTTLTYLIYIRALLDFNIGGASAAGVLAIVLANIVAVFLMSAVARNIEA
ncbi:MAG TPA: sugar ABC transporter permease [Acetobacteraceae bacterium]|jgi:sorbitol/mannitol transport system permease protein|nr:sugar ABC transporter permease [Acetobacteraceae bacterium]